MTLVVFAVAVSALAQFQADLCQASVPATTGSLKPALLPSGSSQLPVPSEHLWTNHFSVKIMSPCPLRADAGFRPGSFPLTRAFLCRCLSFLICRTMGVTMVAAPTGHWEGAGSSLHAWCRAQVVRGQERQSCQHAAVPDLQVRSHMPQSSSTSAPFKDRTEKWGPGLFVLQSQDPGLQIAPLFPEG